MKHWRRTALGVAAVGLVLMGAAVLALRVLVDPDHLAAEARDKARSAWGRDLAIAAVSLDVLPRPTLVAEDVAIANPPWAHEHELLHARRVVAHLALWPLLAGKVRVVGIAIDGARMNLEVRGDGAKSWALESTKKAKKGSGSFSAGKMNLTPFSTPLSIDASRIEVAYRRGDGSIDRWRIERAKAAMQPGLREVDVDASLARNGHALHARGRFADLSRLGQAGAQTQGEVTLDWGGTVLAMKGAIPLDHGLERATFDATLTSRSLDDMLAFFGKRERHTAPIEARAKVTRAPGELVLRDIAVKLGAHRATGELRLDLTKSPADFSARLESDDLDWGQALLDVGDEKPKPAPPGEMFPVRPLPWGMLDAMQGRAGTIALRFGHLKLPDGIELGNASALAKIDGPHLTLDPIAARALGGSVKGTMRIDAAAKSVQVALGGEDVLLERWFRERHRPVHFRGGPMKVRAEIRAKGESMKELAASMSGPVSILMGRGVYDSKIAGDWEARMVNFAKDSKQEIDFECVGAALAFESGKAKGKDIVGARSRESRLLASGEIDLREEKVDLKGSVRPKPGEGVGLATIADEIQITGALRKMQVRLDPESKPKAIAKGALAVATVGLSALATAASNSASPDRDPCEAVFSKRHPPHP
jgi:uncharacterized protein involved in outer membrane biogenesis